jgi:TM2 domain
MHTVTTTCTTLLDRLCLGQRTYQAKRICSWSDGSRWSTTLILRWDPSRNVCYAYIDVYVGVCFVCLILMFILSEPVQCGRMFKICKITNFANFLIATIAFSITLGGFGADRFYLGQWQLGLAKLFTFGGIGLWGLVDIILTAAGYLSPADGAALLAN